MKASEIKVGQNYSNGSGRVRQVISIENDVTGKPYWVEWEEHAAHTGRCTLPSFAHWAKRRLKFGKP